MVRKTNERHLGRMSCGKGKHHSKSICDYCYSSDVVFTSYRTYGPIENRKDSYLLILYYLEIA